MFETTRSSNDGRHSSDQLRILYTLYAVFFTLGLSTVYRYVPPAEPGNFLEIILAVVITLVALRFIFVVEALSKYLIDSRISEDAHLEDPRADDWTGKLKRNMKYWYVPSIHFPFIFIHAFLFYRLCLSYKTLFSPPRGSEQIVPQYDSFAHFYILLLFTNLLWLAFIRRDLCKKSKHLENEPLGDHWNSFWIANNFFFLLPLLVVTRFFPGDIEIYSSSIPIPLLFFVICATGNSIVDLVGTARFYIPQVQQNDDSVGIPDDQPELDQSDKQESEKEDRKRKR